VQRAGGGVAAGPVHHVGQGEGVEVLAHVLTYLRPDGQQDALALVLAGAVLVGPAEVPGHDGAVDGVHDLAQGDRLGRAGQHVAAAHPPFGTDEPGPFESQEDLLQVRLGQPRALGDVAHRGGPEGVAVESQGEKRTAGVVPPCRDLHASMLPGRPRHPAEERWGPDRSLATVPA
jgi:hypothetical protein